MPRLLTLVFLLAFPFASFAQRIFHDDGFGYVEIEKVCGLSTEKTSFFLCGDVQVVQHWWEADLFVYVTDSNPCTYVITKTDEPNPKTRFHWHFVKSNPKFKVQFVKNKSDADFTIKFAN